MKTKRLILLAIALLIIAQLVPFAGVSIAADSENAYTVDDTFESYTAGNLPTGSGWTLAGPVAAQIVEEQMNKFVEIRNTSGTGSSNVSKIFPGLSGNVVVEYKVRVNDEQYQQIPVLHGTKEGGGTAEAVLVTAEAGQLRANNDLVSGAYRFTSNEWHHYKIYINTVTDTWTLMEGDRILLGNKSFVGGAKLESINRISFKVKSVMTSRLAFDDIKIYQAPDENPGGHHSFLLRASSFADDFGSWQLSSFTGSFDNVILAGATDTNAQNTRPAQSSVIIEAPGTYRVWVRASDFATNQQGARFFNVELGGGLYDRAFGKHGSNGFRWEDGGLVQLPAGELNVMLKDTSAFFARFDSLFITDNPTLIPPENYQQMLAISDVVEAKNSSPFANLLAFPEWANAPAEPASNRKLENANTRVTFYEVPTAQGTAIQQKVELKKDDSWVAVQDRGGSFGYMTLFADQSSISTYYFNGSPVWKQQVQYDGQTLNYETGDIFRSGVPSWIVPSSMESPGNNTVILRGENEYARLNVKWELQEGDLEPKVTCSLEAKKPGYLTLGMFNGMETPLAEVEYLLAPLQFINKFLPPISALVSEVTSTNASSLMTVQTLPGASGAATFGIAVDPSSVPYRWAYTDNQKFGLGIRGRDGGVQPQLFAPLLGMPDSRFEAGTAYEISYRPIYALDSWYPAYKHIVSDLYKVRDVRENLNASVTDTVFNLHDLIMNDAYSGWSDNAKGFANMEVKNQYKQPVPLVMLQEYLLTEDPAFYERRTIPTLAYLLTRSREDLALPGSTHPVLPIGKPTQFYGTGIFANMYAMTRGLVPAYRQIGVEGPVKGSVTPQIPAWLDKVYRYRETGDAEMLNQAKQEADQYLNANLYGGRYSDPNGAFYALDARPNVSALLDLYEASNDAKYLDAAVQSARQLLTSTWTQPLVPDGTIHIDADWIRQRGFWSDDWANQTYFWNGLVRHRLGNEQPFSNDDNGPNGPADNIDTLTSSDVPAWLTSRIGWSVEGTATYFWQDSTNVTMTNWAADLLRLAAYTGDTLFETVARNEIIGRAASYPGYYIGKDMTHYMQADYPYTGPDTTNIYYHHIPVYMGILQDYLFAQAWKWSEGSIKFPSVRQYGYVWFENRVYGLEPGTFYGEQGMWPWLKRGLIATDNKQVDWIASRKDGVFGVALMNEAPQTTEVTVTLGDEVTGGKPINGTATVHLPGGAVSEAAVVNGQLTVAIPAKSLAAVTLHDVPVKAPNFAEIDKAAMSAQPTGNTVAEPASADDFGKGIVLQIDPASYYAYVFVPHTNTQIQKAVLHYQTGDGAWLTKEETDFPFEFIEKVPEVKDAFNYFVEITDLQGNVSRSAAKVLKPLSYDTVKPVTAASIAPQPTESGWNAQDAEIRFQSADSGGSGVSRIVYSIDNGPEQRIDSSSGSVAVAEEGIHQVKYFAYDGAGNKEEERQLPVKIDRTQPVVQWSGGGTYTVSQSVYVTCQAADALSGLVGQPCSAPIIDMEAYELGTGEHPLTVTAADAAGNETVSGTNVTVVVTVESLVELVQRFLLEGGDTTLENALISKLEAAIASLEGGQDEAYINQLQSFINQIEAQSGKKIDSSKAELLIRLTQELQTVEQG
ncbi:OmpL47-type beta-barrel domain-containing protein [Paenibacillus beijingensis]|uniref:FIMAH domain-containing protein n=1 Tax=Paenibacillus beijingensis TaxID=1126833 RepID=A0A0D5NH24_9BACL|nr:hypothetical protein [Paenibacillus beijingensis]AJY74257.1 hypothetical protein VN24_06280 [Paenibacillus beijingensis]